jgi:hypothetical protein
LPDGQKWNRVMPITRATIAGIDVTFATVRQPRQPYAEEREMREWSSPQDTRMDQHDKVER